MPRILFAPIVLLAVFTCAATLHGAPPASAPSSVQTIRQDWTNPDRGNEVMPIKIDFPPDSAGPLPVVLISHGLGGSREGLKYIGDYWAAHGYVAIHLQHVGSDQSILKNLRPGTGLAGMMQAATPEQFVRRLQDVKFALDYLPTLNTTDGPLKGKLDLDHVAIAGHSFGAITAEAACGELFFKDGKRMSVYDKRIKAGIIFSPSPPKVGDAKQAFANISIPMFQMTGTKDDAQLPGDTKAEDRRVPFDSIDTSDQYLVTLTNGDHMIFNGRLFENPRTHPDDAAWKELIETGTTAFLNTYLKSDASQKSWLQAGDYAAKVKPFGTYEMKLPKQD